MSKYFEVYNYPSNVKARLATYQLTGKATLCWEENKIVKRIRNKNLTWKFFKKEFKKKYFTKRYFDEKAREFHELKLGQSIMDKFVKKFMSLLRYVHYWKDDKEKIQ